MDSFCTQRLICFTRLSGCTSPGTLLAICGSWQLWPSTIPLTIPANILFT